VEFTAKVESIDPWIVGGVPVSVTEQTKIDNGIEVGDLVTVKGNLLPDGTVVAKKIRLASPTQGCVETSVVVREVSADQIVLLNWQAIPLNENVKVKGKPEVASVIIVRVCADADGNITVVSITVVYQLDALPPPPPQDNGGQDKDKDKNKHQDCKEGPGRGEGHCKNDDDEHDDDDH
ncbi:MAG: hypothetical protein HW418_4059, partial [Anaerolineales bacterium]|nr:hypothetical protein [Anaerolineales bacterium]